MSRSRGGLSFQNESIVIVCEGTETENRYFKALGELSDIERVDVFPEPSKPVKKKAKENRKSASRQLKRGEKIKGSKTEYIPGVRDENDEEYKKYMAEPIRWVRAAHLLMDKEGYYEAWAVYDLDKGRDKGHEDASDYIKDVENLHIAFSAYSFEEWLLLHFERNAQAFLYSECKEGPKKNKKKVKCGQQGCTSSNNCLGGTCLGGRLRSQGYIPQYAKEDGDQYVDFTIERLHYACVNAAWSRSLSKEPFYKCNPYSNADKLVMRLLSKNYDITWVKIGEVFCFEGSWLKIEKAKGNIIVKRIGGNQIVGITREQVYWCDARYELMQDALSVERIVLTIDNKSEALTNPPGGATVLCMRGLGGKEYYFEII